MSFTATFYTFSKKQNSTAQPSSGTDYSIILKDSCDILTPVLQLQTGQSDNPTAFNYCYIPAFSRFYWVRWEWVNRLWVAKCSIDTLASWKSYIGSYSAYVTRAASSYDGDIIDMYYPAKCEITEIKGSVSQDPSWTHAISSGTFVIGVQGDAASPNGGAVTYYAVKPSAIAALTSYLLDVQNVYTGDEISDDLLKCIFNPMQFIVSCMWFPFSLTMGADDINVGWWTINTSSGTCKKITDPIYTRNLSYTVPKHPQAASRGAYLNQSPFSTYTINAGAWGVLPVNTQQLMDETSLNCIMNIDLYTGSGRLSIIGKDNLAYIEDHVAQIGVPIQLGQNMLNQGALSNSANNIGGMVSNFASGNALGALVSGISAIGDVAALSQAIPVSVGSNGSMAFNNTFNMIGRFLTIVDEDLSSRGRPLCKAVTLSSLSGFVMCADAEPSIPCTDMELGQIISYLNNGFYYE